MGIGWDRFQGDNDDDSFEDADDEGMSETALIRRDDRARRQPRKPGAYRKRARVARDLAWSAHSMFQGSYEGDMTDPVAMIYWNRFNRLTAISGYWTGVADEAKEMVVAR